MTYTLEYESITGKKITFSLKSGYIIARMSDPTSQIISFKTSSGVGNIGEKVESQIVDPKRISISGTLKGNAVEKRKKMMQTIVPGTRATITFDEKYKLDVYPQKTPEIERYTENPQFNFTLYAPFPYWRSAEGKATDLLGLSKSFRFPWNISSPNPFRFSTFTEAFYTNVYNGGNVPSKWRAEFYARTDVVAPSILNMVTGEFVKLNLSLAAGESAIVDTTGQELSVKHYTVSGEESDAFEQLDIDSNPFDLLVGDNLLKTDAEENREGLSVRMVYNDYVSGVWA